jgi:hypothetical protein
VASGSTPETHAAGPPGTPRLPLACCASCGSGLVQPHSWHERPSGRLRLELRCPECLRHTIGDYDPAVVAAYDRALVAGRLEIAALCQAVTRANMEAEATRLEAALAFDLIGPDDFAGYNRDRSK